ncbi:MAG: DUF2207 domain-containing protein [Actinomycetota bacterium]|nr:DUF2207 domain-containing protein [Actinomycetota bacterium]
MVARLIGWTFGALIAGIVAAVGWFVATSEGESIQAFHTQAVIDADGTASVTETIDYDFGTNDRRGIIRALPVSGRTAEGVRIETPVVDVTVSSPDAPDDVQTTPLGNDLQVRIGNPNITISGLHRYVVSYDRADVVDVWDEQRGPGIDLTFAGHEAGVDVDEATVDLSAPFELVDVECIVDTRSGPTSCDGLEQPSAGRIVATGGPLEDQAVLVIRATAGAPTDVAGTDPAPPPPEDGPGREPIEAAGAGLLGMIGFGVAATPVRRTLTRAGRERVRVGAGGAADAAYAGEGDEQLMTEDELAELVTVQFAPPKGLRPEQGGMVLDEAPKSDHVAAWLLQLVADGWIDLDERGGTTYLTWKGEAEGSPPEALLELFATRNEVALGKYDKNVKKASDQVTQSLRTWQRHSGLWAHEDGRRMGCLVAALGVPLIGATLLAWLIAAVGSATFGVFIIAGALLTGLLLGWLGATALTWSELRVRTPEGSAAWIQLQGFKHFIEESEGEHARWAAEQGLLRQYSAWAMAFGELDRWRLAIERSDIPSAHSDIVYLAALSSFNSSFSTAATPPSSSGGGGGGGGFGGGGSGVGGGSTGSW